MDLIERTWEEIDCKIKATGYNVWVRTKPHPRKVAEGSKLWLPPKLQSFHGDSAAHLIIVHATVLSSGPVGVAKQFKVGDVIAFQRLHFAYMWKLEPAIEHQDCWGWDEEYVGWIDANQVLFNVEDDEEIQDVRGDDAEAQPATAAAG